MADKLSNAPVWPTLAVKDINSSRKFYEDVLGYKPMEGMNTENDITYSGAKGTGLTIYQSAENAGTNQATCASWQVENLDGTMTDLKSQGVKFEDYDQPGLKTENGVVTWQEGGKTMRAAWFKDPDGNILNLIEM